MIPILYDYNEQTFTSNGLGRLSDTISATVTEERNGRFDMEFQYPVNGIHFDDITEGRIIAVTHDEDGDIQPFVIYSSSKPIDGVVTFNAYHLSYRLGQYATYLSKSVPTTCQQILTDLANMADTLNNETWTFTTDITTTVPTWEPNPSSTGPYRSVREYLGGMDKSVLDTFGGEYEFDKWTVNLWSSRGANNGVTIRYGKNLADFKAETDWSGAYTRIVAYYDGDYLTGLAPPFPDKANGFITIRYDTGHTLPGGLKAELILDLTDKIEDGETKTDATIQTELRQAATAYANTNKIWEPSVSIDVDFVQLWQTEEYKNYAPLLKCKLCDTVNVTFPFYGLSDLAIKIVSVEWDVLNERYNKMTLGGLATTLSQSINSSLSGSIQANADAVNAVKTRTWVSDVTVNGTSVVTDGVAAVTVPTSAKTAFTPTSGSSYSTYGGCFYEVYGNVVVVNISVSGLTANTNTAIYTLPSGVRPKSRVFGKAGSGSGQGLSSIDINTTGVISVVSAGTYCIGSVTYIL